LEIQKALRNQQFRFNLPQHAYITGFYYVFKHVSNSEKYRSFIQPRFLLE